MIIIVIIIIIFPVITETSFHTPDAVGQHNKECGWPLVYHWDRAKKLKLIIIKIPICTITTY